MLKIKIPAQEYFNEYTQEFVTIEEQELLLEHSLDSIRRWEMKHHKPYLTSTEKTNSEIIDYVRCMTLNQVDEFVYSGLTASNYEKIHNYIEDAATATIFSENGINRQNKKRVTTSEEIYYLMTMFQIPFECQYWHLNQLLTLINICEIRNSPKKKMSKKDLLARNTKINRQRRAALKSKG